MAFSIGHCKVTSQLTLIEGYTLCLQQKQNNCESYLAVYFFQLTFGSDFKSARLIAPLPQPISRKRIALLLSNCCNINSTSSSVSGRGMNTGGFISNVKSRKSHSPIMYWIGIRAIRHSHNSSKRCIWADVSFHCFVFNSSSFRSNKKNSISLNNRFIYKKKQKKITRFRFRTCARMLFIEDSTSGTSSSTNFDLHFSTKDIDPLALRLNSRRFTVPTLDSDILSPQINFLIWRRNIAAYRIYFWL